MKKIVIMPGGFHPFHAGHYALYKSALEAFPDADVYVAATNDTKARPFPFDIKEKLAKLAGVESGQFVQVKSPFKADEITSKYDPNSDVLIFVRSDKDRDSQPKPGGTKKDGTPAYFQPYTGKNLQPFSKHGYITYLPTIEFGPGIKSASEIRELWPTLNTKRKLAMVYSLYPKTQQNKNLANTVVKMLDMGINGDLTEDANNFKWKVTDKNKDRDPEVSISRNASDREHHSLMYHGSDKINLALMHKARALFPAAKNDIEAVFHFFAIKMNEMENAIAELSQKVENGQSQPKPSQEPAQATQQSPQQAPQQTNQAQPVSMDEEVESTFNKDSFEKFASHPQFQKFTSYARQHYPESPDTQVAFLKFVARSLMHSREDDERQDNEIDLIMKQVNRLNDKVDNIENKTAQSSEKIDEGFDWSDYSFVEDMDTRLSIVESYFTSKTNLTESNDPDMTSYFISLANMSDNISTNKKCILVPLVLLNNKVNQIQFPEVVKVLKVDNGIYTVERSSGKVDTYPKTAERGKVSFITMMFNKVSSYNKFRTAVMLKFESPLPDPDLFLVTKANTQNTDAVKENTDYIDEK